MDKIEIIGMIAGVMTTVSFFPQAIKTIITKETKGISIEMYSILTVGVFLWMVYGIFKGALSVTLANAITLIPSLIILIMKIKYK